MSRGTLSPSKRASWEYVKILEQQWEIRSSNEELLWWQKRSGTQSFIIFVVICIKMLLTIVPDHIQFWSQLFVLRIKWALCYSCVILRLHGQRFKWTFLNIKRAFKEKSGVGQNFEKRFSYLHVDFPPKNLLGRWEWPCIRGLDYDFHFFPCSISLFWLDQFHAK